VGSDSVIDVASQSPAGSSRSLRSKDKPKLSQESSEPSEIALSAKEAGRKRKAAGGAGPGAAAAKRARAAPGGGGGEGGAPEAGAGKPRTAGAAPIEFGVTVTCCDANKAMKGMPMKTLTYTGTSEGYVDIAGASSVRKLEKALVGPVTYSLDGCFEGSDYEEDDEPPRPLKITVVRPRLFAF